MVTWLRGALVVGPLICLVFAGAEPGVAQSLPLLPHGQISIRSDADFLLPTSGVVGGTGTPEDPFRISGWEIRPDVSWPASMIQSDDAIAISGTTASFVISNVIVRSGFDDGLDLRLGVEQQVRIDAVTVEGAPWAALQISGGRVDVRGFIAVDSHVLLSGASSFDIADVSLGGLHELVVGDSSTVNIRNVTIRSSVFGGLGIGAAAIDLRDIGEVDLGGILVEGGASSAVRLSRIGTANLSDLVLRDSSASTLQVHECGSLSIANLVVVNAPVTGVLVRNCDRVDMRQISVAGAGYDGIYLGNTTMADIEETDVTGSGQSGILLSDVQSAMVRSATFAGNGFSGVVATGGRLSLDSVDLASNFYDGLSAADLVDFVAKDTRATDNGVEKGTGFALHQVGNVSLVNVTSDGNRGRGFYVPAAQGAITWDGGASRGNAGENFLKAEGAVTIKDIAVSSMDGTGLRLEGHTIRVENSTLTRNAGPAVWAIAASGPNHVEGNTMASNHHGLTMYGQDTRIRSNTITENQGVGVFVEGPRPHVANNTIERNGGNGLVIAASTAGLIAFNRIGENGENGVWAGGGQVAGAVGGVVEFRFQGNEVSRNAQDGLRFSGSRNQFLDNVILENGGYGIYAREGSVDNTFERNVLEGNVAGPSKGVDGVAWNATPPGSPPAQERDAPFPLAACLGALLLAVACEKIRRKI